MENEIKTKLCPKCGSAKPITEFSAHKNRSDGLQAHGKACYRVYYEANHEHILAQVSQYVEDHHEEILIKKRQYWWDNRDELCAKKIQYRIDNPEKLAEQNSRYYSENKEEILEQQKKKRTLSPEILLFGKAKKRSKEKNLPFKIEQKDILVPDTCPVFGLHLVVGDGALHDGSPTLDKLVPALGYVPGNISVISHKANTIKSNGTAREHRLVADWLDGKSSVVFKTILADKRHASELVDHARGRAHKHKLPFDLDPKGIFIPNVCPILGIPLERGKGRMQDSSPSLDRIIPENGYVKGNIAVISVRANQIKSHGTAAEHRKIADWIDQQTVRIMD